AGLRIKVVSAASRPRRPPRGPRLPPAPRCLRPTPRWAAARGGRRRAERFRGRARHHAPAGSRGLRREPPPGALPGPPLLAPPDAADRGGDGDGRPDRTGTRRPVGDG